jgi:hypothetical protein
MDSWLPTTHVTWENTSATKTSEGRICSLSCLVCVSSVPIEHSCCEALTTERTLWQLQEVTKNVRKVETGNNLFKIFNSLRCQTFAGRRRFTTKRQNFRMEIVFFLTVRIFRKKKNDLHFRFLGTSLGSVHLSRLL